MGCIWLYFRQKYFPFFSYQLSVLVNTDQGFHSGIQFPLYSFLSCWYAAFSLFTSKIKFISQVHLNQPILLFETTYIIASHTLLLTYNAALPYLSWKQRSTKYTYRINELSNLSIIFFFAKILPRSFPPDSFNSQTGRVVSYVSRIEFVRVRTSSWRDSEWFGLTPGFGSRRSQSVSQERKRGGGMENENEWMKILLLFVLRGRGGEGRGGRGGHLLMIVVRYVMWFRQDMKF